MGLQDILGGTKKAKSAQEKRARTRRPKVSRRSKKGASPAAAAAELPEQRRRRDAPRQGWERWTVYASEQTIAKMKALADDSGESMARLVEAALTAFLARVEGERGPIVPRERSPLHLE